MRIPDYILTAVHKPSGQQSKQFGAAWENEDRSITIKLDRPNGFRWYADIILVLTPSESSK